MQSLVPGRVRVCRFDSGKIHFSELRTDRQGDGGCAGCRQRRLCRAVADLGSDSPSIAWHRRRPSSAFNFASHSATARLWKGSGRLPHFRRRISPMERGKRRDPSENFHRMGEAQCTPQHRRGRVAELPISRSIAVLRTDSSARCRNMASGDRHRVLEPARNLMQLLPASAFV